MAKSFSFTASTTAILTTAEAKLHLKVDSVIEDTYIDDLVQAATESAQVFTNRFFISTTITQHGDKWCDLSVLFKSPVSSTLHIKYYDSDNTIQTLSPSV